MPDREPLPDTVIEVVAVRVTVVVGEGDAENVGDTVAVLVLVREVVAVMEKVADKVGVIVTLEDSDMEDVAVQLKVAVALTEADAVRENVFGQNCFKFTLDRRLSNELHTPPPLFTAVRVTCTIKIG